MDFKSALAKVASDSNEVGGLAKGIEESAGAIYNREAKFCMISKDNGSPEYQLLAEALCKEQKCPLVKINDEKALGDMVGLCKGEDDCKSQKVGQCTFAVVKNFGKDSSAKDYVLNRCNNTCVCEA